VIFLRINWPNLCNLNSKGNSRPKFVTTWCLRSWAVVSDNHAWSGMQTRRQVMRPRSYWDIQLSDRDIFGPSVLFCWEVFEIGLDEVEHANILLSLLVHLSSWQTGIIGRYKGKSGEACSIACLTRPNFGEARASVLQRFLAPMGKLPWFSARFTVTFTASLPLAGTSLHWLVNRSISVWTTTWSLCESRMARNQTGDLWITSYASTSHNLSPIQFSGFMLWFCELHT